MMGNFEQQSEQQSDPPRDDALAPPQRPDWPARWLIAMVRLYQRGISPLLGSNCRYQPTCSAYMIGAIEKYGLWRGLWRGSLRILRCHPFRRGGYDPP